MMEINVIPLTDWLDTSEQPFVISGPCSAESEDQIMATARGLAVVSNVKVFRAGIWKPRTRPGGFQGIGVKGLKWLRQVKEETGLLTTVEVAKPEHIEQCLKYGVDILWIGARTVVNPFSVQEICDALVGIDIPVMIKNPLTPDIKLWIGAIERLNQSGIQRMIAVHRGFHYFERASYRNSPMWEIPIELKRLFPGLPVLCDPSHIAGNRQHLFEISQKALDLEMDGLMIESHFDPASALTDASQQITPEELQQLLRRLVIRQPVGTHEFQTKLERLRTEIDLIDAELLDILARRMKIIEEIGVYKKENDITILQIKRWRQMIHERLELAEKMGLDKEFLIQLLELVHRESIQIQQRILNSE